MSKIAILLVIPFVRSGYAKNPSLYHLLAITRPMKQVEHLNADLEASLPVGLFFPFCIVECLGIFIGDRYPESCTWYIGAFLICI